MKLIDRIKAAPGYVAPPAPTIETGLSKIFPGFSILKAEVKSNYNNADRYPKIETVISFSNESCSLIDYSFTQEDGLTIRLTGHSECENMADALDWIASELRAKMASA